MNSENRKTSAPHRLFCNPLDKINLKSSDKYVALANLSIYYNGRIEKQNKTNTASNTNTVSASTQRGMKNLCIKYSKLF